MAQLFKNNASSYLNGTITAGSSSLAITPSTGTKFPTPSGEDYFVVTLVEYDGNGKEIDWEILRVTANSGDVFTVQRAQEGTVARTWPSGTLVEIRLTEATIQYLQTQAATASNVYSKSEVDTLIDDVETLALAGI